eukprot:6152753-Amphidinium_carterae.1
MCELMRWYVVLTRRPCRMLGQFCLLHFAIRDPVVSRQLNYKLVLTRPANASYARPGRHKRSGWDNIIATREAHRASHSDAPFFTTLMQDFFCVELFLNRESTAAWRPDIMEIFNLWKGCMA